MQIQIVNQNGNFIVVDKPAGWLSVPGRTPDQDPRPILGRELEKQIGTRIFPIHRLDFEVSGIMLWALTPEAQKLASSWLENHLMAKTYQALTEVNTEPPTQDLPQRWESRLLRGKKRAYEHQQGKPSLTLATAIGFDTQKHLKWQLEPKTGRAHQLRYELSKRHFPILGDTLYGAKESYGENQIALRAVKLVLPPHPLLEGLSATPSVSPLF